MKKTFKVLPVLLSTAVLASCGGGGDTPTPTPVVEFAKLSIQTVSDISYSFCKDVKITKSETEVYIELSKYQTEVKNDMLVTNEKLENKVYLVAYLSSLDTILVNPTLTYGSETVSPQIYTITNLIVGRYYVYELPSLPTKDTTLVHNYTKKEFAAKVYYENHIAPAKPNSNYNDLYVSVTLNGEVLKHNNEDAFSVKDMDSVIGNKLVDHCLEINYKKGLLVKFFYKDGRMFNSALNAKQGIWPNLGYTYDTQYKVENGYHTLFTFKPKADQTTATGKRIQFAFEFVNTGVTWSINNANFEKVNYKGANVYNVKEKKVMAIEGEPKVYIDGVATTNPVTIQNLNDSNVKQIKLVYTKEQLLNASGRTELPSKGYYANFNDERTGYKYEKRVVIDADQNINVYLKDTDSQLGPQYPFVDYITEDGYNTTNESALDLAIKFVEN